ncbi:bacteriohemerythrin [Magnetospira sp. QH-2]|uniref:bacteriohemerythrin n=1 Tax=Magnetospira sp. (strain QH-2) TaxID=1288970 RepID=UPI0003E81077|nr:bacteriohemerythrin [Magnetospira sp. QH-2]CCQ72233.1 Putative Hemerythrin [Magnetospira sp. QH-2]
MFIDPQKIPRTGSPMIDAAHARLAEIANEAYDLWQTGAQDRSVNDTLRLFIEMARRHFHTEEREIRNAGFEAWREHAKMHQMLLAELSSLCLEVRDTANSDRVKYSVFQTLDGILYQHEFLDDQDFWHLFVKEEISSSVLAELIPWEDRFSVGDDSIDRQHKTLIKMLNRLHVSLNEEGECPDVSDQLANIEAHTRWHFSYEESFMEKIGMTQGLDGHKALHRNLLLQIESLIHGFNAVTSPIPKDIVRTSLKSWLLDHLLNVDRGIMGQLEKIDRSQVVNPQDRPRSHSTAPRRRR